MIARAIAAIMLLLIACDDDYDHKIVDRLTCVWSERYQQCFCTATRPSRGYLAWAPAEVCGHE